MPFWRKNGKLLRDANGALIRCGRCPCGCAGHEQVCITWQGLRTPSGCYIADGCCTMIAQPAPDPNNNPYCWFSCDQGTLTQTRDEAGKVRWSLYLTDEACGTWLSDYLVQDDPVGDYVGQAGYYGSVNVRDGACTCACECLDILGVLKVTSQNGCSATSDCRWTPDCSNCETDVGTGTFFTGTYTLIGPIVGHAAFDNNCHWSMMDVQSHNGASATGQWFSKVLGDDPCEHQCHNNCDYSVGPGSVFYGYTSVSLDRCRCRYVAGMTIIFGEGVSCTILGYKSCEDGTPIGDYSNGIKVEVETLW